jgi:hypothetical protein
MRSEQLEGHVETSPARPQELRPRAHREQNIDRHPHKFSGQSRHQVVSAIRESLLDDEILPLHVAEFREASPENVEVGRREAGPQTSSQPTRAIPSALCAASEVGMASRLAPSARMVTPHRTPIHLTFMGCFLPE